MVDLSPFSPEMPKLYMTPRAAEQALAAGILAIHPNIPVIEAVRDHVNTHMTASEYRFPVEISDLSIVMRWSGKGAKLRWQWDERFEHTEPTTPYMSSWAINQHRIDAIKFGELAEEDVRRADLDPYSTVEVSVPDWLNPQFGKQFTSGLLFRRPDAATRGLAGNITRDLFEAFDPQSLARFRVAEAGKQFDPALETLDPVIRHFKQ